MRRDGDAVLKLEIVHELHLLQPHAGILHQLAPLLERHAGRGIQPQLAFEQAVALLLRCQFKHESALLADGHPGFQAEFVVGGRDGHRILRRTVLFHLHIALDDLALHRFIAHELAQFLVEDLPQLGHRPQELHLALLLQLGDLGIDVDFHLRAAQGLPLPDAGVQELAYDRVVRVVGVRGQPGLHHTDHEYRRREDL